METKTIDCTPSWKATVSLIILILEKGDKDGVAREELMRMAELADKYVASVS